MPAESKAGLMRRKTGTHSTSFAVAKIISIIEGVPAMADAEVLSLCTDKAGLYTDVRIRVGAKIGLMLVGIDRQHFDLLNLDDDPKGLVATVKMQAVVTSIRKSGDGNSGFRVNVDFLGNIHLIEESEAAGVSHQQL